MSHKTAEDTWGTVYYREKYEKPELERLRAENARLQSIANEYGRQNAEAEMKIERWRAALERIAASNLHDMNTLHPDGCARLAREALEEATGGLSTWPS